MGEISAVGPMTEQAALIRSNTVKIFKMSDSCYGSFSKD